MNICIFLAEKPRKLSFHHAAFTIGDSDDSSEDGEDTKARSEDTEEKETQTDLIPGDALVTSTGSLVQEEVEDKPPRPLEECVAILKSEVSTIFTLTLLMLRLLSSKAQ